MERITISIDDDLLADLDRYIDARGYANRSEGIRDAIRSLLTEDRIADADETDQCVGCVIYTYNHLERSLSSRLVEAQHSHHDIPAATLHLHIDPENCLEATVLKGQLGDVKRMADDITSQVGVKHGHLHMIPVEQKSDNE